MLNPFIVVKKLVYRQQSLSYVFGRFKIVRRMYSLYRMLLQVLFPLKREVCTAPTLFESIPVNLVIEEVKINGVFLGIKIPRELVEEIQHYAKNSQLTRQDGLATFSYHDVKNGYLSDGRPVPQAVVNKPLESDAIRQIINDPIVKKIVKSYLMYDPKKIMILLRWSFVLEIPDSMRIKLHQTVNYHYDIPALNSIFVNFYLSDTDINSGAHVMIKSSHNEKSLRMLFDYNSQSERVLHNYYGKENELVIEGEEGYGFIQDPYCYHKALAPVSRERLMLQIRYF
jgi:hypothetical protein